MIKRSNSIYWLVFIRYVYQKEVIGDVWRKRPLEKTGQYQGDNILGSLLGNDSPTLSFCFFQNAVMTGD